MLLFLGQPAALDFGLQSRMMKDHHLPGLFIGLEFSFLSAYNWSWQKPKIDFCRKKKMAHEITEHESIIQMIRSIANKQTSVREGLRTCLGRSYQDSHIEARFTRFTHGIEVYVVVDRKTGKFVFKTERWWSEDGQSFKEYPQFNDPGPWLDHLKKCAEKETLLQGSKLMPASDEEIHAFDQQWAFILDKDPSILGAAKKLTADQQLSGDERIMVAASAMMACAYVQRLKVGEDLDL